MTRRRIEAADVGLAQPDRRRVRGARRVLCCPRCRLVTAQTGAEAERMMAWHTPGTAEHDCDGTPEKVDSQGEAKTWLALVEAERAGRITNLRRQVVYAIEINGHRVGRYTADFVFVDSRDDQPRVIDCKSAWQARGSDWRFRQKVIEAACGITIEIWEPGRCSL